MPPYAVELSPRVVAQLEAIQDWWRQHRQANPELLFREVSTILHHLQRSPHLGKVYEPRGAQPVRRVLLHRSRYHVYYRADDDARMIRVDAVWHAARGEAPVVP